MINYFGIDILQFPFTLLIFINFIFGIYNSSNLFLKKINTDNTIEIRIFFLFITLGLFISLINILLFLDYSLTKNIIFAFFFYLFVYKFFKFSK